MAPRKHGEPASWEVLPDSHPASSAHKSKKTRSHPQPEGETWPRRSYCIKDLITAPAPGITSIHDVLQYAARTHGNKKGFASRPILRTITEKKDIVRKGAGVNGEDVTETKTWNYFVLGKFEWTSYVEMEKRVRDVGSGLRELGVGGEGETFFSVYSQTGLNWQLAAQACAFSAVKICTAYDSLGTSGLSHSLSEPGVRGLFTNADLLPTLTKIIGETPTVRLVVYDGEADPKVLEDLKRNAGDREGGFKVVTLDEVEKLGRENPKEPIKANKDDVFCCMYTSGSTGAPKGVLLTHENILSAVGAIWHLLYELLDDDDTYLAFLPLAHILEFVVEMAWIYAGLPIGYGRVKTLTEASVRECHGDLIEFKPSIIVGVPAVWELIRKGICSKVDASGGVKKAIFNNALKMKQFATDYSVPGLAGLTDRVVFNQVKAQTGGRLKIALSGGGAVSATTQEFLCNAVVKVIQGYGLTETVGMCTILHPDFFNYGVAGCPVPSMEIKLKDVADAGYKSTNKLPQGEIWLRGPSVTKGYFMRDDLNREAFEDGWFKTGDVGQWNADGTLSIIDRIKNLIKLSDGEYIAVEKLESIYKSSNLVANGCLVVNTDHRQPAMVVVVHPQNIVTFAKQHNIGGDSSDPEALVREKRLADAMLKELNAIGKKAGFRTMELLETLVLTADEWTPESGLLTAAQKLNRKDIEKRYEKQIKAVYK